MPRITQRQQRFIEEFQVDHNATQAAVRAGYSPRSATALGSRLAQKPQIAAAIAAAQDARSVRTDISIDDAIYELSLVAFSDISNYIVGVQGRLTVAPGVSLDALRALAHGSVKVQRSPDGLSASVDIRMWNKLDALKMIGTHLGLWTPAEVPPSDPGQGLAALLASAQEAARERLTQRIAQVAERDADAEDDDGPWESVPTAP
jgi:phage terminase small subunit